MAISPLALGIGLQGKYDYRQQAALEMSRQKGRAKAEADAEASKEKKRAEIRKMIVNIRPQGLLPFQQKIIDDNVADALNYASENQDDFSGVTQRVFEIESRSKAYRDQAEGYKRLSLQQGGMPADAQALRVVGTLSDPKAIQEELAKFGPATSVALTGDQLTLDNPKYTSTGESISKSINSMQFELLKGTPTIKVGDKVFAGADINKNVPALITANIMSDANRKKSAINDYLQFSIENNKPYDFSTPESTNEFLNNTTAWVQEKAQKDVDARSKYIDVTKREGTKVSIYNDQTAADESVVEPSQPKKILHRKIGNIQTYAGIPSMEDTKLSLAVTTKTWNSSKNKKFKKGDVFTATYGDPSLVAVAKSAHHFPAQKYTMDDGTVLDLPELDVTPGEPLMEGYDEILAKKGKSEADYVVFGVYEDASTGEEISIVRPLTDLGIAPAYAANKDQAKRVAYYNKEGKVNKEKANAEIKAKYKAAASSSTSTSSTTTPKSTTTTSNAKQNATPKGGSTSTRRTAEADAAKNALKAKLAKRKKK